MAHAPQAQAAAERGRRRRERVDGILLLDKPLGLSSNHALLAARRLLNAEKAGHGGTLDPMATGLLPLLFGEATKFAHDLLSADKTYVATLRLGVATDSGDAEGQVTATRPVGCDAAQVAAVVAQFAGDQLQVPPMHSALKRDGRPLYELARAGVVVEREPRPVTIHAIEVIALALPDVTIRVRCSKGTYVRTLAADIGERLGCGAHLVALRREAAGALRLDDAVTLPALEADDIAARRARLQPLDALLGGLQRVELPQAEARRFAQGQRLRIAARADAGEAPAAVYGNGRLLGVARLQDGLLVPVRLIAAPAAGPQEPINQRDGGIGPTATKDSVLP